MIRYGLHDNSASQCYWLAYVDPLTHKERAIHCHSSEIKRFHGYRPNDTVILTQALLLEFFTYRLDLEGQSGEYGKKKAKEQARIPAKRSRDKPNSPGEGE